MVGVSCWKRSNGNTPGDAGRNFARNCMLFLGIKKNTRFNQLGAPKLQLFRIPLAAFAHQREQGIALHERMFVGDELLKVFLTVLANEAVHELAAHTGAAIDRRGTDWVALGHTRNPANVVAHLLQRPFVEDHLFALGRQIVALDIVPAVCIFQSPSTMKYCSSSLRAYFSVFECHPRVMLQLNGRPPRCWFCLRRCCP